jgi:uncharacterized protein YkwD
MKLHPILTLFALTFPLALAAPALGGPPRFPFEAADEELLPPEARTRLVVKLTRYCRDGVCVQIEQIEEVEDTARDAREALPELQRRAAPPRNAQPTPAELEPAPLPPRPAPVAPPRTASLAECGGERESSALMLLNAHRASLGLGRLSCDPIALRVARAHSQDMCDRSYFSHTSPEGKAPWDRLRAGGARFRSAGENIASGYGSAREVHAGWLASLGHRQNMERPGMARAAIGVVDCGGSLIWTQLFLR